MLREQDNFGNCLLKWSALNMGNICSKEELDESLLLSSYMNNEFSLLFCKIFIKNGANINASDFNGNTPLMIASKNIDADQLCDFLLKNGANVDLKNKENNTALMLACCSGNIKIVKMILGRNPEINATNLNGQTALMLAIFYCKIEVVRLLIEYKANLYIKDINGNTALDYIHKYGYENIFKSFNIYEKFIRN